MDGNSLGGDKPLGDGPDLEQRIKEFASDPVVTALRDRAGYLPIYGMAGSALGFLLADYSIRSQRIVPRSPAIVRIGTAPWWSDALYRQVRPCLAWWAASRPACGASGTRPCGSTRTGRSCGRARRCLTSCAVPGAAVAALQARWSLGDRPPRRSRRKQTATGTLLNKGAA